MAIDIVSNNGVVPEMDLLSIAIDHSYAYANRGLTYSMLDCEAAAKRDFNKAAVLGFNYSQIEEILEELRADSERVNGHIDEV